MRSAGGMRGAASMRTPSLQTREFFFGSLRAIYGASQRLALFIHDWFVPCDRALSPTLVPSSRPHTARSGLPVLAGFALAAQPL